MNSSMNRWASDGSNAFANAKWDEAWKTANVNDAEWREIRDGLATRCIAGWRVKVAARGHPR